MATDGNNTSTPYQEITGTLYGTSHYHWAFGFFFGAALGAIAMLTLTFLVKRPTEPEMEAAVRRSPDKVEAAKAAIV